MCTDTIDWFATIERPERFRASRPLGSEAVSKQPRNQGRCAGILRWRLWESTNVGAGKTFGHTEWTKVLEARPLWH